MKHLDKLILTALFTVVVSSCRQSNTASPHPLPPGHVEIHVEYKDLPQDASNKLVALLGELAEKHSAIREGTANMRAVGDRHAESGWGNDGFASQYYGPNHPIPSPEIEQAMKERLKSFLQDNKIDPGNAKLELRYGK